MDIVLHKRLLALQAENSMLKEEIQKLQELKDQELLDYLQNAARDWQFQTGRAMAMGAEEARMSRMGKKAPEGMKDRYEKEKNVSWRKMGRRRLGIERALRFLQRRLQANQQPPTENNQGT